MYLYDQRPATFFDEDTESVLAQLSGAEYAVLVGPNNCGKSYILKTLTQRAGAMASYLGPARYQNFNLLGYFTPNRNRDRRQQKFQEFLSQWQQQQQNIDNSPVNLQQAVAEMTDERRERLVEIVELLLGSRMEFLYTVENNSMSQKYISVDGQNLSYTSSGFRLITTLVASLLDTDYDTFFVDEPELGISPEAQGVLADFLFDAGHRAQYFGHIKTLVFGTHSTIFLDRLNIANNYRVSKHGDAVSVTQVQSQADFNKIHFSLLGNRFETLYLPSVVVLVEGKTDSAFIQTALAARYPGRLFSVINAGGDGRMKQILSIAKDLFADIQRSPYRERIIAVLDSVHGAGLRQSLVEMGLPDDNLVVWSRNGIEHLYPPQLLDEVFGSGPAIAIDGDHVSRNGITYTKAQLSELVCAGLGGQTALEEEFERELITRVDGLLG